jgi:hypothetical protein
MSEVVLHPVSDMLEGNDVPELMLLIRPQWQAKGLIERVRRLLPVDPSSACQRLFNASIADLREKVKMAGLDIAKEAAATNSLPPINRGEDVENYSAAKILDLAYRMGLLTRPEWRRMTRVYDIRRDLEHEDSEYEAGIEDVVYIFKTCIEAVLSKDPVTLIRVADFKDVIQAAGPAVADERLVEDYRHAPDTRQLEIYRFLVSAALDEKEPDLVRENAFTVLGALEADTRDPVVVDLAKHLQDKIGRRGLTDLEVRVSRQTRTFRYLRKAQRRTYFKDLAVRLERINYGWRSHASHGAILRTIVEVGGLSEVTAEELPSYVKWMVLCYLGEPGGYGAGTSRPVFYSNSAVPIIEQIFTDAPAAVKGVLGMVQVDKDIVAARSRSSHVSRRFDALLDLVEA